MNFLMRIRGLLVTSFIIAILVVLPTVSAVFAHSCCNENAELVASKTQGSMTNMVASSFFAAREHNVMFTDVASMAYHPDISHHQDMDDSDCEAVCCGSLVVYGLTFNEPLLSDSWGGLEHFSPTDNIFVSAAAVHITPPPRFT